MTVGMELFDVYEVFLRICCVSVLEFYERSLGDEVHVYSTLWYRRVVGKWNGSFLV